MSPPNMFAFWKMNEEYTQIELALNHEHFI